MRWFDSSKLGGDCDCFGAEVTPEAFVRELDIAVIDAIDHDYRYRLPGIVEDWADALGSGFGVRLDPHMMDDDARATIRGLPADAPHIGLGMFKRIELAFSPYNGSMRPSLTVLDDGRIVPAFPRMAALFDGYPYGVMGGVVFDERGGIPIERLERLVDAAGGMIGVPVVLSDRKSTIVLGLGGFSGQALRDHAGSFVADNLPKGVAGGVGMAEEVFRTLAPDALSHARGVMNGYLMGRWCKRSQYSATIETAVDFCARNRAAGHSPEAVGISLMAYLEAGRGLQGAGPEGVSPWAFPWECRGGSGGGLLMPPTRFDGLAVEAPGVYREISRTVMDAGFVAYNSDPARFDIEGLVMADEVISEVAAACDGITGLATMPGEIVREDLLDSVSRMRAVRAAMDGLARSLEGGSEEDLADYRRWNALARMVLGDR